MNTLILDSIDGNILTNPNIRRLYTHDSSVKVVLRSDWDPKTTTKVAVLCGGGSGHAPFVSGYVGTGMLTAAICGELFSSPTTNSVLQALLAVTGKPGSLLLLNNYTGDILNFSLAAKIVETKYGLNVKCIIIDDDCALVKSKITKVGRRGIAGCVFIPKIAAYLSEQGKSLNEVYELTRQVLTNGWLGSIGLAATSCHLPGQTEKPERMKHDELELGLGVHGEPGLMKIKFDKISNLLPQMVAILWDHSDERNYLPFLNSDATIKIAILINNLGGITPLEMGIIKLELVRYLTKSKPNVTIERIFVGSYLTSLDMRGFSISVLNLADNRILSAIDFEVAAPGWINGETINKTLLVTNDLCAKLKVDSSDNTSTSVYQKCNTPLLSKSAAQLLKQCITNACEMLIKSEQELNSLDAKCGDADCGFTLKIGATNILKRVTIDIDQCQLVHVLQNIGEVLADMGGSSGALYGYLFVSAAQELATVQQLNNRNVMGVFNKAVQQLSQFSGAELNDCTMIDALIPAVSVEVGDEDVVQVIRKASKAAISGSEKTAQLVAKCGRSSNSNEQDQIGVVDPGARAVAIWISAMVNS